MSATVLGPPATSTALRQAYEWCRAYARRRQENFTVVSWFLPAELRPHFFALYAFCRWTDDLGDEAPGDRLALLDAWERELRDCFDGRRERPLFVALGATIDRYGIPPEPFLRLIEANRMDQRVTRFETYGDLLRYCERSATPVGRMVLAVLGYRDEERGRLADATCVGLQLANFWQDVSVDLRKGRVYIPQEDLRRFGYSEEELRRGVVNEAFREMMRFEVGRARALFREGRALEALVDRRARVDVRLFRLGGEATLDAIEAANYDVLTQRPRVPRWKKAWLAASNGMRMKLGL
ncbi:MAG TPA: squalene synthase HpnC [Dehalococcoidia bacterium]|jgi:squalene synthase HpnC|nr:squalene synthase HpnC [Dehalococcoidia bacterium]